MGIAMGAGTDIAIEAGDIVLVKGSLMGLLKRLICLMQLLRRLNKIYFGRLLIMLLLFPWRLAGC